MSERHVQWVFLATAAIVVAWLLATLYLVNIEFDDGYSTIANSKYLLGNLDFYFWQRGPFIAALLMPAEFMANALGLHPLDVRLPHLTMIGVHAVYFVGVWMLLRRQFGATPAALLAFLAAIPTTVFFSYAPFISHDIFPGLIVLLMLWLADRYSSKPEWRHWLLLIVLGSSIALAKQTYALAWVAVLLANTIGDFSGSSQPRSILRTLVLLGAAAMISAVITWCGYAYALGGSFPNIAWLWRPAYQAQMIVAAYQRDGVLSEVIYQWVYLRNLSAYGMLAMALVIPGLYYSLTSADRLLKKIAVAWIFLSICMCSIAFKEVRYLAYLAPLTAFLIVPAIMALVRIGRGYWFALLTVLALDMFGAGNEAARLVAPYYRHQVTEFLAALPVDRNDAAGIVMTQRLSFVSPERYAFFGDRFHRITNIVPNQLRALYGYEAGRIRVISDRKSIDFTLFRPGDVFIFVNGVAARVPPIHPDNRTTQGPDFVQLAAVAEQFALQRDGDHYRLAKSSTQPIMLIHGPHLNGEPLTSFSEFAVADVDKLLGTSSATHLDVLGFRVYAYCNIKGCRTFR